MSRPPLTDSPWFWFALFTAVGLSALLATGGRFGKRQSGIEQRYQARRAAASGQLQVEVGAAGETTARGAPEYSTPDTTIIPLWPLKILLGVVCAGSIVMLLRERSAETPSGSLPVHDASA